MNRINGIERWPRWLGHSVALCCVATACLWSSASPASGGGLEAGETHAERGSVHGYFEAGRALVERGRPQQGLLYVAVAVATVPDDLAAQMYLLTVLDRECCRTDVVLHEELHAVLPHYHPVTERLAVLHEGQVQVEQAGAPYPGASSPPTEQAEFQKRLGNYFRFVGQEEMARSAFSRAKALHGRSGQRTATPSPWKSISLEPVAEQGNPIAMFVTGRKYIVNAANAGRMDWMEQGLAYLEGSARAGFTAARRFLGALYLAGELVPQDVARGVAHYERAASAGDVIAQKRLAEMYFDGTYLPQNYSRAAYWYQTILQNPNDGQTAYKRGEMWEIQMRLASLYLEGKGVERDPVQARALWERAARETKAPQALRALGEAFENGVGGVQREQNALMLYAAAARGYLDRGYEYGVGPEEARRKARAILEAMEHVQPRAKLTRNLRTHIQELDGVAEGRTVAEDKGLAQQGAYAETPK